MFVSVSGYPEIIVMAKFISYYKFESKDIRGSRAVVRKTNVFVTF